MDDKQGQQWVPDQTLTEKTIKTCLGMLDRELDSVRKLLCTIMAL